MGLVGNAVIEREKTHILESSMWVFSRFPPYVQAESVTIDSSNVNLLPFDVKGLGRVRVNVLTELFKHNK